MNRNFYKIYILGLLLFSTIYAESFIRLMQQNGFGSRSFSLANNYVALSNDVSAVYWNPAGLSFSQAREVQLSVANYGLKGESDFYNTIQNSSIRRLKIPSAGFMYSVPATRGGLTFAVTYDNPLIFDDLSVFSGLYRAAADERVSVDNIFKTTGGLNFLSGALGLQVAPKFGVGLAVSYVNGREDAKREFIRMLNGYTYDNYTENVDGKYYGIDVRGGVYYKADKYSLGARFALPQYIRVKETISTHYNDGAKPENESAEYKGKLYSSYSGAAGASVTLPFMTISVEARGTLPFDYRFPQINIPDSSQAHYFKVGGGVGIECPVIVRPILLRCGYSFDEIDLHQYAIKYDGEEEYDWSDVNMRAGKNKHQITAGIGFYSSSVSFDIAYGFSMWQIIISDEYGEDVLFQDYKQNKISATLSLHY